MTTAKEALAAMDSIFLTICPTTTWPSGMEQEQGRITLTQYNAIRHALTLAAEIEARSLVVVPREPTFEMVSAFDDRITNNPYLPTMLDWIKRYKAMLRAYAQEKGD
jgi:hypothetical protein